MNNYKYPTNYELREIFSHIANRKFLTNFAQSKGIFITYASQEYLAVELSNLFYEDDELEIIRAEAYKHSTSHSLTGFVINSKNKKFSLKASYESLRDNDKFDKGIVGNTLIKLQGNDFFDYKGSIEYKKAKPGRIEFLQDEQNTFDFYLKDLENGKWQVEIDCGKSTDAKILRDLFSKNLPIGDYDLELIDQDMLDDEKTILFFDYLAHSGMHSEWSFLDIKHLTVRRGRDTDEDNFEEDNFEKNDESTEMEVISKENLSGITQAILSGKNLRDDEFVKQCESRGYRFTAMTYEFEHKTQPYIISVRAEFKGRPKVFEVGLPEIQEKIGTSGTPRPSSLPSIDNRGIRSMFWNNASNTFKAVLAGKKPSVSSETATSKPNVGKKKSTLRKKTN